MGAMEITGRAMHTIAGGPMEAIEFNVQKARCLGAPLKALRLQPGVLIGCVVRGEQIIIPTGETCLQANDTVIVITKNTGIDKLDDILL